LKVKVGGGNAGHNGLRSITAHMGNDYHRVRIGVGHPGVKDAVAHYVLRDFAKVEYGWLDPLLDAMADAAPWLAKGDGARFLSQVALKTRDDEAPDEKSPPPPEKPARAPRNPHPAGERASKRAGALAENLKKWLAGRGDKE
jgi:PTH1 family peptidyl-tRNA hydrolase